MTQVFTPATLEIGDDDPVRLSDAVDLFFPRGGMSLSALRTEARKGRLVIERIAGKDFVTKRAIHDMRARCRDQGNRPASTYDETATSESGSSATGSVTSAQDALRNRLSRPLGYFANAHAIVRQTPSLINGGAAFLGQCAVATLAERQTI